MTILKVLVEVKINNKFDEGMASVFSVQALDL